MSTSLHVMGLSCSLLVCTQRADEILGRLAGDFRNLVARVGILVAGDAVAPLTGISQLLAILGGAGGRGLRMRRERCEKSKAAGEQWKTIRRSDHVWRHVGAVVSGVTSDSDTGFAPLGVSLKPTPSTVESMQSQQYNVRPKRVMSFIAATSAKWRLAG